MTIKKISLSIITALLTGVLIASASAAATYYVATIGHDANDGSAGAPWGTLQKASNSVGPGDLVLVADGTYAGFYVSSGGTAASPITFQADGTNVLINTDNSSTPDGINIENADYVVIDGFKVENASRAGIRVATSTGVVIKNCSIERNARWGIFTAFATDVEILDNLCASNTEEHGIYISNSNTPNDNPTVSGNECYGNGHNGIQLNGDCTSGGDGIIHGAVLEGNFVHDNGWKGFSLISVFDSFIMNNVVFNNGVAGIGAGGIHLTDEPSCGLGSRNNVVVNNTVVEFNITAIRIGDGATANTLFNNIVIGSNGSSTIADETGGNAIDSGSNITATVTAGLFQDAAARDYRLITSSPARDAGRASYSGFDAPSVDVVGSARPSGSSVDIGAYELVESAPPPPPPPGGGAIIEQHPRLWLVGSRLAELRQAACYDDQGNPIPGCTSTPQWNELMSLIVNYPDKMDCGEWALAYKVTGNTTYRDNAISDADAQVAAGWQPIESVNYRFLYLRDYIRSIACAYDWLYDELSPARRSGYLDYMSMLLYITYNNDAVSDAIYSVGGWGIDAPGNNFYYNFMLSTAYVALASYGEHPGTFTYGSNTYDFHLMYNGTAYTDILQFFYDKFDEQSIGQWLNSWAKGGGWHEGNQYGPSSKRHMFEALLLLRNAGGTDYFNSPSTNFPAEAAMYHIYATQPGGKVLYNGGDAGREEKMQVYDYDRHCMLALADGLQGRLEGEYSQYWVQTVRTDMSLKSMRGIDFLLTRPGLPSRSFNDLPNSYFASGLGWMNSRSGWQDDAVSVSFISADKLAGHQHNDQNAFQIYRGGSAGTGIEGWLVTDAQPFSQGLRRDTEAHNTIVVDNAYCQRHGTGAGKVLNYQDAGSYTYIQGDAADAYYDDQEVWCYSQGGTKQLNTFVREFVHVLPNYVVVFDRVSPVNPNSLIRNQFHFHNQPDITANLVEAENGNGKVFQKVLWPASPAITKIDEQVGDAKRHETWKVVVEYPAPQPNYQFLNYFYVTSAGTTTMPDAVKIDSANNKMTGAKIMDPGEDIILFFSTDPAANPPAGSVIYEVGMDKDSHHYLFNLLPLTEYSVDVAINHRVHRITVAEGAGYRTNDAGVLEFDLMAAPVSVLIER